MKSLPLFSLPLGLILFRAAGRYGVSHCYEIEDYREKKQIHNQGALETAVNGKAQNSNRNKSGVVNIL